MIKKYLPIIILFSAFLVHLSYYYFSFLSNGLNFFFEHVTSGQDFFQIPNAVYSFVHGGGLTGDVINSIQPYIECCGVNTNVYHPLFTIIIGLPLIQFSPWSAFYIWVIIHILFTFLIILYVWRNYSKHNYLYIAISLYLFNSYNFYEIKHAQYHFLLSFFVLILLSELIKNKNNFKTGILYFCTLIIKPIGLLWFLPLLIYKKYKTALVGIGLFALSILPFFVIKQAGYYLSNIVNISNSAYPTYNLYAITQLVNIDVDFLKAISFLFIMLLLYLQIYKNPSIFKIFFLWIGYQLIFYSFVFHYHYSILGVLFMLGILINEFSIKKIEIVPIVFLTIPAPVIIFRMLGDPPILPENHLATVALWSVFWLTFLMIIIIYRILEAKK